MDSHNVNLTAVTPLPLILNQNDHGGPGSKVNEVKEKKGTKSQIEFQMTSPKESQNAKVKGSSETIEIDGVKNGTSTATTGFRRYIGIIFAFLTSLGMSLAILIVKIMANYHPYNCSLWRFMGILIPTMALIPFLGLCQKTGISSVTKNVLPLDRKLHWTNFGLLILSGAFAAGAVLLQFAGLKYISMGDAVVISFSTPIFVAVVARIFLNEACGFIPVFVAILSFFGVVIISRPPFLTGAAEFDENNLIGTILSFASMIHTTGVFVTLRKLRAVHFLTVNIAFGLVGSVASLTLLLIFPPGLQVPLDFEDWSLALGLGALTFLAQSWLNLALKFEVAFVVSLVRTCDIIAAFLWQFLFFGQRPDDRV